ncbi:hypothetical protein Tco_0964777 [Tanacetum coccineum]
MVASHHGEELLDSNIDERPSPRALKRALLVCLRCMDTSKRPRMGQTVHMLKADEFPFCGEFYKQIRCPTSSKTSQGITINTVDILMLVGVVDSPDRAALTESWKSLLEEHIEATRKSPS